MFDTKKSQFPAQKLSLSQKTTKWKESCVDGIVGREGGFGVDRERMKTAYDLYNGIFKEEDLKYVTNPFKVDDSFPAALQNFNIIRPKINLLLGEQSKRPNNIIVFQTNDEAGKAVKDKMKKMLLEVMLENVQRNMGTEETEESKAKFEEEVKKITNYVSSDYTNPAERVAHASLEYLRNKLDLTSEDMKGFKDGLIAGKEIFYTGIFNGDPITERVNPIECAHDNDPEMDNIEDGDWFVRHMKMTPASIYDRFNDIMSEEELNNVLALVNEGGKTKMSGDQFNRIDFKITNSASSSSGTNLQASYVDVWHVCWRSFKKIGFLKYTNDAGEEVVDMVDETYKPMSNETIEWDWITEIWEGYRVGTDIYLGMQPLAYQGISIDNPNGAKLPYVGSLYSNTNSTNRSLVDIMKPLAYMYVIIWYRLELALSRDKGKIINMDITQIPKSMNVDVNKWLHYLTALGVNFINPYEEGWDIPGREGGKPASFNQISAQDLTMTNVIANYIDLMNKIEEMLGELCGVSRQRQGSISSSELVGNVERAVVQSSHITETLFFTHNNIKKRVYSQLLNAAKHAWRNSEKKSLYYVLDDMSRNFIDINEDFLYSDFGVFLTDSSKEHQNIEVLKSLLQPAMQNGASLLDAAHILTSDNMNQIKKRLEDVDNKRDQMMAQQQQAQQQMQEQTSETQRQQMAMEATMRQEEIRIREEDSMRKAETAVEVAMITANSASGGTSAYGVEDNNFMDELEQKNIQLKENKQTADAQAKTRMLVEAERKNKKAEEFKAQEIAIKKKVASKPTSKR